jgi:hypothetical protein
VRIAAAGLLLAAPLLAAPPAAVRREPVLPQVKVPHSYYWREMYVPQATSGPSAATWSPDGREVVYSMQGSLWRQALGSTEATQLTSGPGYDHQPDWSPDGRELVYSSYRNGALDLMRLDLATGETRSLVANGAVNLDARWSPDGRRLAFVSTTHEGRWHVFTVESAGGTPVRVTEDRDSGLPRYYYSRFDHYLSPTWSPDGRELILVSNRGHIWGSGGLWRMAAEPGATAREIHYEETTWKARPDWSPDGRRVVYSSYHGRQWNQLWLLTAEGGDPFPLTYGEFDLTAPRWSRDGTRIAAISNEGGNTSLVVIDLPGGRHQRVEARTRHYRGPVGQLDIRVEDEAGRVLPARLSVVGEDGRGFAPDDAWRHADEALVPAEQPFEHGYFHAEGRATVTAPAGRVVVEAWRGPEYAAARQEIAVAADAARAVRLVLRRLADLPAAGWWGGDLHVHMNYGGAYRNAPERLVRQGRAEGLHLIENLVVNKEQRIPDISAFRTTPDPASRRDFLLVHGQEFHTSTWGHTALLGLREHYLLPDYAGYANTAAASLWPTNTRVAELARAQGGLMGYVHPFDTRPDPDNQAEPLAYALPVDAALGTLDYLEVMGFSDHLITSEIWYRLLNCGFRIPAGAGTDAFPNFASLRGPVGLVRTYVRAGPRLDHDAFLQGLKRGRTFVTNAPLLTFDVDGQGPGEVLRLPAGGGTLRARVGVTSAVPLDHVEVVGRGKVVASVPLSGDRTTARADLSLPLEASGWLVLRAWAERPRLPVLDLYPFASTSPVYVEVGGAPVRSREDADYFVRWMDRVLAAARAHSDWNTPAERDAVLAQLDRARAEYVARRP